ncbi:hypothetical protein PHYPSEUDO_003960 [Phytophthora pseudosyringae]|uniref:Uncharacterized protein n=1 Tax=Phytophthora pseudosyringae TaxID=221518 RepID=A0A8T1VT43_9STRA|nr:hypothetical protein PHYPSEUDO_003960 [Phytophthora pseudosyringae]
MYFGESGVAHISRYLPDLPTIPTSILPVCLPFASVRRSPPPVRAPRPQCPAVLTVHSRSLSQQQAPSSAFPTPPLLAAMISPLKDIVVATVLGIGAGMVWNTYRDSEMDRISRFYKWYDAQEAQKKNTHADD